MSGIIYHLSTKTKITVTKTFIFLPTFLQATLSLQCKMCRASSHTIGDFFKKIGKIFNFWDEGYGRQKKPRRHHSRLRPPISSTKAGHRKGTFPRNVSDKSPKSKGPANGYDLGGTNRDCARPSRPQKPDTGKVHFLETSRAKVQNTKVRPTAMT
jgi:hypothetical protein